MKSKIIVIGSGGHAKVVRDILSSRNEFETVSCTLEDINNKEITGLYNRDENSKLADLFQQGIKNVIVGIGDNKLRKKIADYLKKTGFNLVNAVSDFTYISHSVKIGNGVVIMPGAVINADAVIEDNVIINTGATVDHDCIIGEGSHIAPGCNLSGKVQLGQGVFLGTGCRIIDKISIGEWTIVGAGASVVKDLPSNCTAVGVPAKVIKNLK